MKSIRAKILLLVLVGTILSAAVVGALSIQNTGAQIQKDSAKLMHQACQNSGLKINAVTSRIAQSVETLADCALNSLTDLSAFQTDGQYVSDFTAAMENTLLAAAKNTEGAVTAYLRYNPDFTEPTSGLFLSRGENGFEKLVPTDFSIYDKTDVAHVGWYYIPVENKKPTWMSPYLNENLQIYMISYVVPLYKDGVSVGILGMDIDFGLLEEVVDETAIYDTGYAFLADADNRVMYHKDLTVNQDISQLDAGVAPLTAALGKGGKDGGSVDYTYGGAAKRMSYMELDNGMRLVLTAPLSEINRSERSLMLRIAGSAVAAIVVSVLLSLIIIRGLVRPLENLNRAARRIADGDLEVEVSCQSRDEIGTLTKSIQLTVARLKEYVNYIAEISHVLDEIAGGNLVFELKYDYAGEFARLRESLLHISRSLNHTLWEISRASSQVSSGSEQVSSGAQALSQGASEQAAAVRELSSAIREIAGRVNQNAENARDAHSLSMSAAGSVMESSGYMKELSAAMQNIADAADRIHQIVKTVEDIASQTNILALNAAVESARAGEAGKGFAVVAGEVRALAVKVGAATKDIAELVDNAIKAVDGGAAVMVKAGGSLNSVTEKASAIEEKLQQISESSRWQAYSIAQVNQGIQQISAVVQTNSATAQEDAAASEEMSGQAQLLRELISKFRLQQTEQANGLLK